MNGQILIPATFIKVSSFLHNDKDQTELLCGINLNSGVAVAECYKVPKTLTGIELVGQANAGGKDDSVTGFVRGTDVYMRVSEADTGGSGSTSAPRHYIFANKFPASVIAASSNGIDTNLRTFVMRILTVLRNTLGMLITELTNLK